MLNHQLNLTKHQQQVLDDLGIGAWYLQPLIDHSGDAQKAAITEIVGALSASLQQTDDKENNVVSHSAPAAHQSATYQVNNHVGVNSVGVAGDNSHVSGEEVNPQSENPLKKPPRRGYSLPPSIELTAINCVAPADEMITFAQVQRLAEHSWQGIDDALHQLKTDADSAQDGNAPETQINKGFGNKNADWLFVMPPLPHGDTASQILTPLSQKLMTEWLACLGKSFEEVYVTPLIKQSVKIPRDPDSEWLASHLSILQSEIGLVSPKRIFLMGRLPCQRLLNSSAPLSELMKMRYQLSCSDDILSGLVPLTCLPSLEYFCKLPSEKSWLWQVSKQCKE